jgi:hypothetical protein
MKLAFLTPKGELTFRGLAALASAEGAVQLAVLRARRSLVLEVRRG